MNPYLSNAADPYKTKYEEALRRINRYQDRINELTVHFEIIKGQLEAIHAVLGLSPLENAAPAVKALKEELEALRKEIAAVADEQDPAGAEILDIEGEPIDMTRVVRAAGSAAGSVVAVMDDGSNRIVPDAAAFWAAWEAV